MIIDQLFTPKPLQEGGPYDLPGKDYDRPGDTPRKRPSGEHNPYPYSPEEDDDYFREIFRKKREAAAKDQGMAEATAAPTAGVPAPGVAKPAVATQPATAPAQDPSQPYLDKLGARAGAAPGSNITQVTDAYQQKLLDRMGKRFGLPPGSTADQVQAAQQAYLDKNDPTAAAQYKQNMANIDAGNTAANKPLQLAPKAPGADFTAGLAAQKAGASPTEIMLAQPGIAGNQSLLDAIAPSLGLPAGSTVEQLKAAAKQRAIGKGPAEQQAIDDIAKGQGLPAGMTRDELMAAWKKKVTGQFTTPAATPAQPVAENAGRAVNDKGLTQQRWLQLVQTKFPTAKIVQAKMIDGPCRATLPDGRTLSWTKVEQGVAEKAGDLRPKLGTTRDKGKSVRKWRNERGLNEAMMMEDPVYRNFKQLGQYIAEQKLTEPEILQIFSNAETGMTDRATGANRTFLGRGKDTTMDFAGGVKDAVSSVLNSIQTSTPVAAVDVAYDQATDALANVAGGQKGAVMAAIKKYRNLVKEYPKTAGFAKAALVAIAGLATGGAGLPAIAGLTYALDSAIKGDKLSSVIGKGAGTAALAAAGQAAFGSAPADASSVSGLTLPDADAAINSQADLDAAREWINADEATRANIEQTTGMSGAQLQDIAVSNDLISNADSLVPGASRFDEIANNAVDYKVKQGDTLSDILADRKINPEAFKRLPGNEVLFGPDGNPNILKAGQTIKLPDPADVVDLNKMSYTTPSDPNLAKDFDTTGYAGQYNQNSTSGLDAANNLRQQELGRFGSDSGMSAARVARDAVRESVKFRIIPANRLIDQKATVLNWALNESVGRRSQSVNLTTIGALTVFENVDRYRRAIVEYTQPGREQIPNLLRPDMPGAPVTPDTNPGMIGRGLNALDRFTSKVGGGLSNFGRQFTTGVTKEKLKMNWHQAGKPTDSDQLAAWLVTQKVPQQVVTDVFSKMGIPYTAPTTQPTAQPAAQAAAPKTGGASTQAYAGINPATKKPWTQQELRDKFYPEPAAASTASADTVQPPASAATATSATAPAAGTFPGEDPKGPGYVGRREVARRQAARDAEAAKKPAAPNFAQQGGGYKSVTYAPNIKTGANLPKPTAPAAPTTTPTKTPTQAERDAYVRSIGAPAMAENRIAMALKKPVAEMLQMVETKEDVQRIKQFVDDTFVKYGAVNESAFALRNQILEHVTQAGAQRRREHSQRVAH